MTTHAVSTSTSSVPRTALLLVAAIAVAGVANSIIAAVAVAAGASSSYPPLMLPVYLAFTVAGVAAGYVGWRVIRSRAAHPASVLRVVVPVALVLSWVPDVVLAITQFIPGTNLTGALALGLMHLVVVAVAVPVYARIAPVASAA
ncbi:hypothetical protein BH11ACT5_BH11ACT5_23980 [soil metagenome]